MHWTPSITTGLSCLVIGLLAGFFLPRQSGNTTTESTASAAAISPTNTKSVYAHTFPKSEASASRSSEELLRALPPKDDYKARSAWLSKVPSSELPQLIGGLCDDAGPEGLDYEDKYLVGNALEKWWKEDTAGLISWLRKLPNGEAKRYLVTELLTDVAENDPSRAKAIAASFKTADPEWDDGEFLNSLVMPEIRKAWQKPGTTAEQMLSLYKRLRPGDNSRVDRVEIYPANFDFRGFLDGLNALGAGKAAITRQKPSDILEAWAKTDPQAAAGWLFEQQGKVDPRDDPYHHGWSHIARGVAARSGPQAYHRWAAQMVAQFGEKVRDTILIYSSDEDLIGIVENIDDTALRDEVALEHAARRNDIDMFASFSTPEARLGAIARDPRNFYPWIIRGKADPAFWSRAGLTAEQVEAVLRKTPPPVCPRCQTAHY